MKTLVLGASENPDRYANRAIKSLRRRGHEVVAVGLRTGKVEDVEILTGTPEVDGIDTITLYMKAENQEPYLDYLIGLKPKRIIFNPGTANPELEQRAEKAGIEPLHHCTLVMLASNVY